MTEVKICGITDKDDALFAASLGVDALGYIFYAPSLRYITPERAREIIAGLPQGMVNVGVFVNHDADDVKRIVEFCRLDLIQLHGDESAEYCRQFFSARLIKAVSRHGDMEKLQISHLRAVLVDARVGDRYGGTGQKADWQLACEAKKIAPLILSGGLKAENIVTALREVAPQAVDINSGVESSPGKKDREKLRQVMEIIRNRDDNDGVRKIFRK